MIVEYTPEGRITHVIFDPVNPAVKAFMEETNIVFLDIEPNTTQVDILTDYVKDGSVASRPTFDVPDELTLKVGQSALLEVPANTEVNIDGEVSVVEDGSLEIEAEMVAEFVLFLSNFPYIEKTVKVTVHEA